MDNQNTYHQPLCTPGINHHVIHSPQQAKSKLPKTLSKHDSRVKKCYAATMIILASTSAIRQQMLSQAGIEFKSLPALFDEEKAKQESTELSPRDLAAALALGKAQATSAQHMEAFVIGADQTLEIDGAVLHKPKNRDEAAQQLIMLRGRYHSLHSALAVTKDNHVLYKTVSTARLKMREFSDSFLQTYLTNTPSSIHGSVGCYQLESLGVQLFDQVEGDYFTILGLPLLPLLAFLRESGEISA